MAFIPLNNIQTNPNELSSAGTPTWVQMGNSSVEYFIGDGSTIIASNGDAIDEGGSPSNLLVSQDTKTIYRLGSKVDGTQDIAVLCATSLSAGLQMLASMKWIEL